MNQQLAIAEILPAEEPREERIELVEYWRAILHRKWSIIGLAIAIAVLASVIVSTIKPVYRATATVLLETGKTKVVSVEEVYGGLSSNREFYQTQAEIIKSRDLARKVVARLKLAKDPEFDPRQREPAIWQRWAKSLGVGGAEGQLQVSDEAAETSAVGQVAGRTSVEVVRGSQLLRIGFEATNPELAARIANGFADIFIESDLESRYQVTQKAADWLNGRIAGLRQKLGDSEKALQEYREREKIVDAKGLAMSGASSQLGDLQKNLSESRQRRAEIENAYNQVRAIRSGAAAANFESIPAVIKSPLFSDAKKLELEAEKKVSELSQRYGREHPRMVQADAELKTARENTRKQAETIVAGLSKEYEVAKANEAGIERALAEARDQVQNINRKEYQLSILEREVASNRQLYDMFIGRSKETSATNDLQTAIGRVVDRALTPGAPIRPNKNMVVMVAFLGGLLFAIVCALLLERLDNTVKTSEDVETKLRVAVLTTVPLISGRKEAAKLAYLADPKSVFSEAIRTARTGVLLSSIDTEHKVLVITSSVPNEGKTTFAMSLAFAHAQTKRVLLIDADMRRPTIAKTMGIDKNVVGLSDFISGAAQVSQVIHSIEGTTAKLLPAGHTPPNPLELLLSPKFSQALARLKELFDVIILDSPPVQLVSDAMIVARHATGVIYVVKADDTPYPLARIGLKKIRMTGTPIIGVALNQLDFKKADRYYGEYSGYYSYGYKRYYGAKG
jgi:capsular exopolysaccharide synthesis family protein